MKKQLTEYSLPDAPKATTRKRNRMLSIPVSDPFGITNDPKMPFLVQALNPLEVQHQFQHCSLPLTSENGQVQLNAIRVTRYRPGLRCLLEYDLGLERPDASVENITLVGKVLSSGQAWSSYHLVKSLWDAGFGDNSEDGICVPEPMGVIPEFQMWLQRKVPGELASKLLVEGSGVALAKRLAQAIHKLHQAGIPTSHRYTMADDLRRIYDRLLLLAQMKPQWTQRLERLFDAGARLANTIPEPCFRSIHRDFHSNQVIVDGSRLYLLDFDDYCEGDPALDLGYFLGNLTRKSLRTFGTPDGLAEREKVLTESFLQLSGQTTCATVSAYKTLKLMRKIYNPKWSPERWQVDETWLELLELCEQRLGLEHRALNSYI